MNFKNAKTSILTNGFRTNYFKIYLAQCDRVAQSISPLLYIHVLHAEPFTCVIRKNENRIGIHLLYINPDSGKQAGINVVSYVEDAHFCQF